MSKARYVTGLRAVEQLLSQRPAEILKLFVEYRTVNPRLESIVARANDLGIEIQSANRARLTQLAGEARHQGVVADIRRSRTLDEAALRSIVESTLEAGRSPFLLVLDGVQDPHNLGACLRTADAAGVDAVVVPRHGAAGLGPTVSKVAAGAAEAIPFAAVANVGRVLDWLKDYGVAVVGTSERAPASIFAADLGGAVALVMGREHSGLRHHIETRCDRLVSLPMLGTVASLNVSVATGICLFEAVRQRRSAETSTENG